MNNTTSFLPIELQNIIIAYTRPVYPYTNDIINKVLEIRFNKMKKKLEEEKRQIEINRNRERFIIQLKRKIKIFELKNEEYKLEYEEESGLTFINYYFTNYYKDLIRNIDNDYYIEEILDMGCNCMDSIYYSYLEEEGYIEDGDNYEKNFLIFFFLMVNENINNNRFLRYEAESNSLKSITEYICIDFRDFINDFEDRYSVSDSDDSDIVRYSDSETDSD